MTKGKILVELLDARGYSLSEPAHQKLIALKIDEALEVEFRRGLDVGKEVAAPQATAINPTLLRGGMGT